VDDPSKRVILVCELCGERMVLNGPLSVWSLGTTSVGCECGERLTLADSLEPRGFGEASGTTKASPPTSPPPH
jgi:hypothetical protein